MSPWGGWPRGAPRGATRGAPPAGPLGGGGGGGGGGGSSVFRRAGFDAWGDVPYAAFRADGGRRPFAALPDACYVVARRLDPGPGPAGP